MKKNNLGKSIVTVMAIGMMVVGVMTGCGNNATNQDTTTAATNDATQETTTEVEVIESGVIEEGVLGNDVVLMIDLPDGVYEAEFNTDSSMFRVNESKDGKGVLTVKDGQMTIHVSLASKGILQLYSGLAADAEKEGAKLIEPTIDTVTYSDGMTEEVYGFDIPVPYFNADFDVALIGKKGKWYDHKVNVKNPGEIVQ